MICKKCGNIMNEGEVFCNNCGTAVNAEEVQTTQTVEEPTENTFMNTQPFSIDEVAQRVEENKETEVTPSVEPTLVSETQSVEPTTPVVETAINNPTPAPSKKGKVAGIIIGVVAGGLVVLIVAIVIIVMSIRGAFNKAVNTATTKPSTNTSTTTENKHTVPNDTKSPYKTRKPKTNPSVKINLTGMTGKEIVDNILDCTEISNGDKAYYYTDRFVYESPNYILVNKEHKFGKGPSWSWKDNSKDAYITHVALYSIKEKDDGTVVILDNPQVQVSLEFKTYETGKETYDAFCDLFDTIGETFTKEKEGGESYHLKYNDNEYFVSFNNPSKEGRPYEMFVWIPVMYFMAEK